MKKILLILPLLAGCSLPNLRSVEPEGPRVIVNATEPTMRPLARDEIGGPEPEPVRVGPVSGQGKVIGTTIASLGNPAEPGLWVKTPLVTTQMQGRVSAPNGANATVTLIPIDGPATAGSQISLQAMQALGLPLTALPNLRIERL